MSSTPDITYYVFWVNLIKLIHMEQALRDLICFELLTLHIIILPPVSPVAINFPFGVIAISDSVWVDTIIVFIILFYFIFLL